MRVVGALVIASAIPILLLAALGLIGTGSAIAVAVLAVLLGLLIIAATSL